MNANVADDVDKAVDTDAYQPGQYVACIYDDEWHIGNIAQRSDSNQDVLINFMRRNDNKSLVWSHHEDKCWVPFLHVLCGLCVPEIEGASARKYKICEKYYDRVEHMVNQHKH